MGKGIKHLRLKQGIRSLENDVAQHHKLLNLKWSQLASERAVLWLVEANPKMNTKEARRLLGFYTDEDSH